MLSTTGDKLQREKKFDYSGRPVQLCVSAPNTAVTMYDAIFSSRTMKLRLLIGSLLVLYCYAFGVTDLHAFFNYAKLLKDKFTFTFCCNTDYTTT